MADQPTEVFGLYAHDGTKDKIVKYTQDPTEIGNWVLADPGNACVRLKLPDYWQKLATDGKWGAGKDFFDTLAMVEEVAATNDEVAVQKRLANLTHRDYLVYCDLQAELTHKLSEHFSQATDA